jgi:hypothetical protein
LMRGKVPGCRLRLWTPRAVSFFNRLPAVARGRDT